jgi:hypothetical protein
VINLFDDVPARADGEIFTEVLSREDVRIEGSSQPVSLRQRINPFVRGMMNGCYSSPARRVSVLKAMVSATFVGATTF